VTNDTTEGYRIGDRWVNEATGAEFMAIDVTEDAAVWRHISGEWQVIDSQTPTGSATISLPASGALSTLYNNLLLEIKGLQHNDGSNRSLQLQISDDGTNWSNAITLMTGNVAAATPVYGFVRLDNYRSTDPKQIVFSVGTGVDATNNTMRHGYFTTETGVITHMRIVWGGGTNTGGTCKIKAV
jgi:hypothetical protein